MPNLSYPILEDPQLKNSVNSLFQNAANITHLIYLFLICFLGFIALGITLINVPVYIQARGMLRPTSEVNKISCPVQGIISTIYANENQYVTKSGLIVVLDSEKEKQNRNQLLDELKTIQTWKKDLRELSLYKKSRPLLASDKYSLDNQIFHNQLAAVNLKINLAETEYKRYKNLYESSFVSEKEFEEVKSVLISLIKETDRIVSQKHSQWINELNDCINREREISSQINELNFFIEKSEIIAPFSGIVQGIRSRYPGEFCSAGTILCSLIPDTSVMVELVIPPRDIGLISKGQEVRLLVDSYDFKYWGTLKAFCTSISEDVEVIGNQPFFRVLCEFTSTPILKYRNLKVTPVKGMTLTAQFLITKKTIWQLLRDNAYNLISQFPEQKENL